MLSVSKIVYVFKNLDRFSEILDLELEQNKVQSKINSLLKEKTKISNDISSLELNLEDLDSNKKQFQNEIKSLGKEKTRINNDVLESESNLENLKDQENIIRVETNRLSTEKSKINKDILSLNTDLTNLETRKKEIQSESELLIEQRNKTVNEISDLKVNLKELSSQLSIVEDDLNLQEHGLYEPKYDFGTAAEYKTAIQKIRKSQKEMMKAKTAIICNVEWTVSGSRAEGKKMTNKYIQLMARAFNGEFDSLISKVKYNNFASIEKRIESAYNAINKVGESHTCRISSGYFNLKIDELHLVHEYHEKLQDEKEREKERKERIREEEKAQKEIEKAQIEAEKEEERYERALEKAWKDVQKSTGEKQKKLEDQIRSLNEQLEEAKKKKERATSRAQVTKSGYVYIISNIGSFGENVYKIGMTRRLEPFDRIKELSGASVPFRFDVHAMIFSNDAPGLENLLHSRFKDKSINKVNNRKEFFNVSLYDVKDTVRSAGFDTEFVEIPEAEEYRKSLAFEFENEE